MGFAQLWRGEEAAAPRRRAGEGRERRGEEERETGTGGALEIWTPGGRDGDATGDGRDGNGMERSARDGS